MYDSHHEIQIHDALHREFHVNDREKSPQAGRLRLKLNKKVMRAYVFSLTRNGLYSKKNYFNTFFCPCFIAIQKNFLFLGCKVLVFQERQSDLQNLGRCNI